MRRPSLRAATAAVTPLLLAVALVGCSTPGGASTTAAPGSDIVSASPDAAGAKGTQGTQGTQGDPSSDPPGSSPSVDARPTRLRIPAIGVDSSLERLRIGPAGRLRPPVDPDLAGWFPGGAVPGDLGAAVIAGHRDSLTGKAVFWRLTDLETGDRMWVTRSDGTRVQFEVVDVRRVSRASFPTEDVYGPTPDRTLRLITCGGVYDHVQGRYLDNVLVLALAV